MPTMTPEAIKDWYEKKHGREMSELDFRAFFRLAEMFDVSLEGETPEGVNERISASMQMRSG